MTQPVYWCTSCEKRLSESEIAYSDHKSHSIYVKFDLTQEALKAFPELQLISRKVGAIRTSLLTWTTTPWVLPATHGIALRPSSTYVAIKAPTLEGTEVWIMAENLQGQVEQLAGFGKTSEPLLKFPAENLEKQRVKHPFLDLSLLIVLGESVTLEAGTGILQVAPGHGADDSQLAVRYGLESDSPINEKGKYTSEFAELQGCFVFDADSKIIEMLQDSGHLLTSLEIQQSYPHCWRCHDPVILKIGI